MAGSVPVSNMHRFLFEHQLNVDCCTRRRDSGSRAVHRMQCLESFDGREEKWSTHNAPWTAISRATTYAELHQSTRYTSGIPDLYWKHCILCWLPRILTSAEVIHTSNISGCSFSTQNNRRPPHIKPRTTSSTPDAALRLNVQLHCSCWGPVFVLSNSPSKSKNVI